MGWFGRWRNQPADADDGKAAATAKEEEGWSDQLQQTIATKLNDVVDIPILGEQQEQKLAEKLIDFDRLKPSSWVHGDGKDESSARASVASWLDEYISITPEARSMLHEVEDLSTTQTTLLVACTTASFAVGFKLGRAQMPFTKFTNVTDIPSTYFGPTAPFLRGRVVSVSDGDTIRFLSAPTVFHTSRIQKNQKMSDVALPIRICTIDTPETAKFGKEGQPFGEDAKKLLSNMVDDKIVNIRLLQKDQYGKSEVSTKMEHSTDAYSIKLQLMA